MSEIWLTSDNHFGHENIIKYCKRPFKNANVMNKMMIDLWNITVDKGDTVYILGDFTLVRNFEQIKNWTGKLNGTKHLILGNHDELKPFRYIDCGFASVHTSLLVDGFYMAHDPAVKTALPKDSVLLHGHVHCLWRDELNKGLINVGVDVWEYKPVNIKKLKELLDGHRKG